MNALYTVLFALGVLAHLSYFRVGEHHLKGPLYGKLFFLGLGTVCTYSVIAENKSYGEALLSSVSLASYLLGGLYSSLVIYRVFFHPLNKFTGPSGVKVSSMFMSARLVKGDLHRKLLALHEKHGYFVRAGTNTLSVTHPDAVTAIHGVGTKCYKSEMYDIAYPMSSVHSTRDSADHAQRRRLWSTAFSDKALRGYEERIKVYRQKLIDQIMAHGTQPVDVTKWFHAYSFDVMGDMAFGTHFNQLEDTTEEHGFVELMNKGIHVLQYRLPTWLFRVALSIPGLNTNFWNLLHFCDLQLDKRYELKPEHPDIMAALLAPYTSKGTKPPKSDPSFIADGQLIVIAGSDTTAATLTNIFYELVKHPEHIDKLRAELAPYIVDGRVQKEKIQNLEHLNGVINEALRLHPVVPTTIDRITPPEGLQLGETHIPGGTVVFCPQYVMGRSESNYKDALSFIPERWYSRPELLTNKSAYAPFNIGVYNCIGKALALQNIRNTLSELLTRFDVSVASKNDVQQLEEKTTDQFTVHLPPLHLYLKPRDSSVAA